MNQSRDSEGILLISSNRSFINIYIYIYIYVCVGGWGWGVREGRVLYGCTSFTFLNLFKTFRRQERRGDFWGMLLEGSTILRLKYGRPKTRIC